MSRREEILSRSNFLKERMSAAEWGELEIRELGGIQRRRIMESSVNGGEKIDPLKAQVEAIIESVYDPETGQRMFQESDRDALMLQPARLLDMVGKVALRLSGMLEDDEKNGLRASATSGTASPETPAEPSTSS